MNMDRNDRGTAAEPAASPVTTGVPRQSPSERPLTARSVLASALLGSDPPELPVAQLVRLAGLFAINENRARVALSRMVAAGDVTTDGSGRYRLSGDLLARQERQTRSRSGELTDQEWDGRWITVVLTGSASTPETRSQRRASLARARLAELREGVWMRPTNLEVDLDTDVTDHAVLVRGTPDTDATELAAGLWDLSAWSTAAGDLLRRLERTPPTDHSVLAPGFVLSASVLRHLQADPLLPADLLPPTWRGTALRQAYRSWDEAYRVQLAAWHRGAG